MFLRKYAIAAAVGLTLTTTPIPQAIAQTPNVHASKLVHPVVEAPFTTENERCIVPAAMYHGVNYYVLRAILKVESGLNPRAFGRNNNGTVDVGMGQHNSMHFKELAQFGLAPSDLMNACVSTYVAAWHLKKNMDKSGNTWEGIARYHSATPYFNQRYQILLKNELIRSGAMSGSIQAVPSLSRTATNTDRNSTQPPVASK